MRSLHGVILRLCLSIVLGGTISACDNNDVNIQPVVSAGSDVYVEAGEKVTVSATVRDDGEVDLEWTQVSGPPVNLMVMADATASFDAPPVTVSSTIILRVTVDDGSNAVVSDEVQVTVSPQFDSQVVTEWNNLGLTLVKKAERGPTISSRFMAYLNAALYSAWAAYSSDAAPWLSTVQSDVVFASTNEASTARFLSMSTAAYHVFVDFAAGDSSFLNQAQLEIDSGEDAEVIRAEMLSLADSIIDESKALASARLDPFSANSLLSDSESLANAIASEILAFAMTDGAQPLNNYADSTAPYGPIPWAAPAPTISQRNNINFYNEIAYVNEGGVEFPVYEFPDYDPRIAARAAGATWDSEGKLLIDNPLPVTINPAVLSGDVRLSSTWQSLTEWGIFPPTADGGTQVPLTSHWGEVSTFALASGAALRPDTIKTPYVNGALNMDFVDEAAQLVGFAQLMKDRVDGGALQRAQSEYWELGDSTPYPPGWWTEIAVDLAVRDALSLEESLRLMMTVSQAVFDAGVTAWDSKFHFDSVRPYTVINQLYLGSVLPSFRGDVVAGTDDRNVWFPFQLRRNFTPPFPDVPSGHSAFSYAATTVISQILSSNIFDYQSEAFISRFDLTDGFDGDAQNGNEETTLSWEFLSLAAEEAGRSRLYGGIHMMDGNWIGLKMGIQTGHAALAKVDALFSGAINDDAPDSVWLDSGPSLNFGTMKNDQITLSVVDDKPVEVYGFYGDDTITVSSELVGKVSVFGGDGSDTFEINGGAMVSIKDYQLGERILVGDGPWGAISANQMTVDSAQGISRVLAPDASLIVSLDGTWKREDLLIEDR